MRILVTLFLLTTIVFNTNGQILISILLGDKLNSERLEFGLDGGLSLSEINGLSGTKNKASLNLGFYFDLKFKNPLWMVHTGIMAKSTMGARDIKPYSLGNPDLDNAFAGGSVTRKLGYFNLPILIKHKFKNHFFFELGPMFGLMNRSTDEFIATVKDDDDLTYKIKIRDNYHPLDAGMLGGVGYKLLNGKGMNLGVRYYYGFVDITIDDSTPSQSNRSFYFFVGIPIGGAKKTAEAKD